MLAVPELALPARRQTTPMRFLIVNGNTTVALTEKLHAQANAFFSGTASIHTVSAKFGPAYIASRAEAVIAAHAIVQTVEQEIESARDQSFDACVLACFGEPGIGAVRERWGFPVVGMAEASILTALQLGDRYSIVTVGQRWPGMLREQIRQWGLQTRCASIEVLPGNALDYVAHSDASVRAVSQAIHAAADQGADVVIAAGAALAGYISHIPGLPPVQIIDSYRAALAQALALSSLTRAQHATRE